MARPALAALTLAAMAAAQAADPPAQPASGKFWVYPKSGKYWVYLGTYTGGKDGSKGIYRCELDAKTGKLSAPEVAAEVGSPSFVALGPNGKTLYAVGETSGKKDEGGGVYAFAVDPPTGKLTKLNESTSGGAGPCHVSTDNAGQFAVVANYGGGSCAFFKLRPDGGIEGRTAFVQHKGSSVNKARQSEPHAHCGFFDETGNYALISDLGLDKVLVYKVNRETGAAAEAGAIKLPDGSGPRHLHIAPSNDLMFVCGEIDCTVNVVRFDLGKGTSEVVQSLSTLPAGKPGKGDSTAEVRIHPNGKWVYVSNRGHNSIAAFTWDGRKLTAAGHATEGIKTPRNFNVTPDGRWMLVANQDGNSVAVFEVDQESGLPKPTGNAVAVSRPVCVKFLAKP